jgi:hypothetical protein
MARGRTSEQCANGVNSLAASPNHPTNVATAKLQLKNSRSAAWNFRKHHVVRKFNQLPDDELEKFSHAPED